MAYSVTGESADIASAWPRTTALVACSWPSNLTIVDRRLARVGARLALGGQFVGVLGGRGLHRDLHAARVVRVDVVPLGLAHRSPPRSR